MVDLYTVPTYILLRFQWKLVDRWSEHFMHSVVKCLLRETSAKFYWNRFIFDRHRVKYKLAQFLLRHGVDCCDKMRIITRVLYVCVDNKDLRWNVSQRLKVGSSIESEQQYSEIKCTYKDSLTEQFPVYRAIHEAVLSEKCLRQIPASDYCHPL